MKKLINFSLSLMATALALTSCSQSDDSSIESQDKGNQAVMTIKFENPKEGRAAGTPVNESAITGGTVMVFRTGTGILDGMQSFTSIAEPIQVNITAGTRDVYVVANTGINFSAVQNVTDLNNFASKYALSTINIAGTSLPMSGSVLAQNATAATMANPATITVMLNYMCSKVNIAWNTTNLNPDMASFAVKDAYILNVPSATDCFAFGTNNLTQYSAAFSTGLASPSVFSAGTYYPASPYTNTYTNSLDLGTANTTTANNGNNFFYIFENNKIPSPTIVVIQGTVTVSGIATTYYYPVVINGAQNTTGGNGTATVVRGQYYSVTATIKGFGNTNPYAAITNAAMDVTIIPASWSPVININENFD